MNHAKFPRYPEQTRNSHDSTPNRDWSQFWVRVVGLGILLALFATGCMTCGVLLRLLGSFGFGPVFA